LRTRPSTASCADRPRTRCRRPLGPHRRTPTWGRTLRRRAPCSPYTARETTETRPPCVENASPTAVRPRHSSHTPERTACAGRPRYTVAPWAVLLSRPGACVLEPRHYLRRRDWATALSSDQSTQSTQSSFFLFEKKKTLRALRALRFHRRYEEITRSEVVSKQVREGEADLRDEHHAVHVRPRHV